MVPLSCIPYVQLRGERLEVQSSLVRQGRKGLGRFCRRTFFFFQQLFWLSDSFESNYGGVMLVCCPEVG